MKKLFKKLVLGSSFYQIILKPPTGKSWEDVRLDDIPGLLTFFASGFLQIIGIIAVIMLVWGGIQYFLAYGNDEKAQKAKITITYAIIGIVVSILAWILVDVVWILITGGNAPTTLPSSP